MRRLTPPIVLALSISLHSGGAVPQDKQQSELTAHNLDISYRKCAVVVLTDQIKQLGHRDRRTVYVSIFGVDADEATLEALRPLVASIRPGSQMPHLSETASDHWLYSVSSIHRGLADGYTAVVNFYCGMLCGASIEYQLKKEGDSCAVVGQRILVQQ